MNYSDLLWYKNPAKNFNEALPLGNGHIGAMIYGGVKNERISLNEDTLWSGYPKKSDLVCKDVYEQAGKLVLENKNSEAQKLLEEGFGDFLVQQYLPLGELFFEMSHSEAVTDYKRKLTLENSVHKTSYKTGGIIFKRECFVSRKANILAMKITSDKSGTVGFRLRLKGKLKCFSFTTGNALLIEGNCPVCRAEYGKVYDNTDKQIYSENDEEKGIGYRAGVTVTTVGGSVTTSDGVITVESADEAYIYFAVRTSFNGAFNHPVLHGRPYKNECISDLKNAVNLGYANVFKNHIDESTKLYNRTYLNLGESENSRLPTDERLLAHKNGAADNSIYTLLFNFAKYLTVSASHIGTQAMNLQGIWNEKLFPPWSSNYTLNINTEMNYWPALSLGLFECYEPLIELIKGLHKSGKETAKNYYGKNGFVSHHATDIWCSTHPSTNRLKNSTQWGFWCMSGGWLTKMLFDYYEYTGNKTYLAEIYPIILDCVTFYKELLIEYKGELIICPSTSPENNYLTKNGESPLDKTTAMTMEMVRDVFACFVKASDILNKACEEIKALLPKLRGIAVNSDGSLNEWYTEHKDWELHHRHVSHLYGLFPSNQFDDVQKTAAVKTLEIRGDNGTGWSLAWKINLWARLGDGEHALKLLDRQLMPIDSSIDEAKGDGGSYPNLFCAHPPFQIDGNFGVCSGIINMLLQADGKEITLLPALPKEWKNGEIQGLCIPGNKKIDFKWADGKVIERVIKPNNTI